MIELGDEELERYIERNISVVRRIVHDHDITAIHAVLMSVVAQRVGREAGIPFTVMPHGSDIEYAVKKYNNRYRNDFLATAGEFANSAGYSGRSCC